MSDEDEYAAMSNPWYEPFVRPFVEGQAQTEAAHGDIAASLRTLAATYRAAGANIQTGLDAVAGVLERMADGHARLAAAIPAVAQAAADLGTASDRHAINNLQAVVRGEQQYATEHNRTIEERLEAIERAHVRGEVERAEILSLLRALHANGGGQ